MADHVDAKASDKERATTMWDIISRAVEGMYGSNVPDDTKLNLKRFLFHVAWHEGMALTARRQKPSGQGRSFYQFETPKARDAIEEAQRRQSLSPPQPWLNLLVASSGKTERDLLAAYDELVRTNGPWPPGETNLVEQLLLSQTNDLFPTYMARMALARIREAVPDKKAYGTQAEYWAKHWKEVFKPGQDREAMKSLFETHAKAADAALGVEV